MTSIEVINIVISIIAITSLLLIYKQTNSKTTKKEQALREEKLSILIKELDLSFNEIKTYQEKQLHDLKLIMGSPKLLERYFHLQSEANEEIRYLTKTLESSQRQTNFFFNEIVNKKSLNSEVHSKILSRFDLISVQDKDFEIVPAVRYLHIEIYLDSNEQESIATFESQLNIFLSELGFISDYEVFERKGSWWKKLFAKSKDFLTSSEVKERLEQVEHAIRLKTIEEVQSKVDKNQADGIAALLKAAESSQNVAFRVGSLIAIKTIDGEGNAITYGTTLTPNEMIYLQKNPTLIRNPKKLMEYLNDDFQQIE